MISLELGKVASRSGSPKPANADVGNDIEKRMSKKNENKKQCMSRIQSTMQQLEQKEQTRENVRFVRAFLDLYRAIMRR
jgi:hypothetical protein